MRAAFFRQAPESISCYRQSPTAAITTAPGEAPRDVPVETVLDRQDGHYFTYAHVNNEPVRFLIDTGASMVALTQEDARRIGVKFDPSEFTHVALGASGPVNGKRVMLSSVTLDGERSPTLRNRVERIAVSLVWNVMPSVKAK